MEFDKAEYFGYELGEKNLRKAIGGLVENTKKVIKPKVVEGDISYFDVIYGSKGLKAFRVYYKQEDGTLFTKIEENINRLSREALLMIRPTNSKYKHLSEQESSGLKTALRKHEERLSGIAG